MLGVVVQIDGWDPVLGAPVSLRASSHDDPAVCHLAGGDPWWPALTKLPTLRYDLFDGAFGGEITAPSSSLTLSAEPWANFGRYALADAQLQIWTGEVGQAWGAWTRRFVGRISEQPELENGTASIDFAVDDRWLDGALLDTYAGTTGAEGTADLKGQPKPLPLGAPRYIAGTLIDSINSVFQVSAYGPVHGFEAGLEKLARFGATAGDFASYAALVAANVPAGRWATAKAVGMARLGAPPAGQISFLVAGDEAGPNGWARKPGQIIRRLALLSGGAGKINDASLNALDALRPYNLSVYIDQQTTARQLIQQIAASVNAVAGMSWTGELFVVPVEIAAPVITLAADGSALPPVTTVKQIGIASPFQKLAIGAERAWTVHALADIAFTAPLVDVGAYNAATVYREGNIVSLPDGSRWLYVITTSAAGHAPGVDAGAYWKSLNPATKAGDITFADGNSLEDLKPAQPGADVTQDHLPAAWEAFTGKPAKEVVSDLAGAVDAIAAETMRGAVWRGEADDTMYMPDGRPVRVVVEAIGTNVDGIQQFVAFLKQVDSSAKTSKFMFSARSDGSIVGIEGIAGGGFDQLSFVAGRFLFVDESGGNPINAMSYENGVWRLKNIEVDTFRARSVDSDTLALFSIRRSYDVELASNVALPFAPGASAIASIALTKDLAGSALEVEWMMRMRPGGTYGGYFELTLSSQGVVDQVWYWAPTSELNDVRSARSVQPYRRRFDGIAAGPISLSLRFVYYGHDGGTGTGFIEAGSSFSAEEIKR